MQMWMLSILAKQLGLSHGHLVGLTTMHTVVGLGLPPNTGTTVHMIVNPIRCPWSVFLHLILKQGW